jgi:nucleoside-diphosphate-sugar epimerase
MNVMLLGAGYVGYRLAQRLREEGYTVWTLRRSPQPEDPHALQGDLTEPETIPIPPDVDRFVFCAGLQRAEPDAYHALFVEGFGRLLERLRGQATIKRLVFTSTTGVYGVTDGSRVDEDTLANPVRPTAQAYRHAECLLADSGLPGVTVRLSGIYGPGRCRWIDKVRQGEARKVPGPPRYMNHLHVDDAAGAIAHQLTLSAPSPVVIASDREPIDRNRFLDHLAHRLDCPSPPMLAEDEAPPLGRGGNKQCDSRRLVASGYCFRYPTFREGYDALIHAENG